MAIIKKRDDAYKFEIPLVRRQLFPNGTGAQAEDPIDARGLAGILLDAQRDSACRTCGRPGYEEHSSEATARCQHLELLAWAIDAASMIDSLVENPIAGESLRPLRLWARALGLYSAERPRIFGEMK